MGEVKHPGLKLKEVIVEKGITFKSAAKEIGISYILMSYLVNCHRRITLDIAIKLGRWLGNEYPVHYWVAAQFAYDIHVKAKAQGFSLEEAAQ